MRFLKKYNYFFTLHFIIFYYNFCSTDLYHRFLKKFSRNYIFFFNNLKFKNLIYAFKLLCLKILLWNIRQILEKCYSFLAFRLIFYHFLFCTFSHLAAKSRNFGSQTQPSSNCTSLVVTLRANNSSLENKLLSQIKS